MSSGRFYYNVEDVKIFGIFVKISGWAFLEDDSIASLWLTSAGPSGADAVKLVSGEPRPDVFDNHLNKYARMAGFLGEGLILTAKANLCLKAVSAGGRIIEQHIGHIIFNKNGEFDFRLGHNLEEKTDFSAGKPTHYRELINLPRQYYAPSFLPSIGASPLPLPLPSDTPVSILVSVYKGREFLDDFFKSFSDHTQNYAELIVVDNGNTDQDLSNYIAEKIAEIKDAKLVRVEVNEGYIEGIVHANRAREHDGHIVVLNTDISLPEGWLERLIWPLDHLVNVATATPFTNAGTCCSFPYTGIDNLIFRNLPLHKIDDFFRRCDPSALYENLPTGVGFCMALHKDMLHEIGYFEQHTFGLGYGEENDWCLKAEALGWSNILVPDLFVYHKHGGVYPSEQKRKLIDQNLKIIFSRYPHYGRSVEDFFRADRTAGLRGFAAFAIAAGAAGARPVIRSYDSSSLDQMTGDLKLAPSSVNVYRAPSASAWLAILQSEEERWLLWGATEAELQQLLTVLDSCM